MRTAERIANELDGDGQTFEHKEGRGLHELATEAGADVEYGKRARHTIDPEDREVPWDERPIVNVRSTDIWELIRYGFGDGSAIVVAGGGWDFEGEEKWSWAG